MRHTREKAFTLVELLLASAITAVIIGGGIASMSAVLHVYKLEGNKSSAAETAQLILERMRLDLAAAYLSPHSDATRFVGTNLQNGDMETDNLMFMSCVNSPVQTGGGTSDMVEIQYYIDTDEETPERWLIRRFDPTPDQEPFTGGMTALLGPKVESLSFQYYDGEAWYENWDSNKGLPAAVNVTVGIFQPTRPEEVPTAERLKQFSSTIWLASRREITYEEALVQEEESTGGEASGSSSGGSSGGSSDNR